MRSGLRWAPAFPAGWRIPTLELFQQGNPVASGANDNWTENQTEVQATGLAPTDNAESALVRTLDPGAYTVIVRGKNRSSGIGVVEAFDLGDANAKLANISSRGLVETADNVVIGGFIAGPATASATRVVVRGIGPSLKSQLPAALDDTTLELRDVNGALLEANDDWQQSPGAARSPGREPRAHKPGGIGDPGAGSVARSIHCNPARQK